MIFGLTLSFSIWEVFFCVLTKGDQAFNAYLRKAA